jgi:uncharacterized damage-inducible protein DinB
MTMKETERIEDQLKRAFEGKAWHGPAVNEALEGVTAEAAARRPVANAHSIWELVHHIAAWADIVRRGIQGEKFEITDAMNFPPVSDTSEAAWKESLQRLDESQRQIRAVVLTLPESRLTEIVVEGGSNIYVLLHGVVQHAIYHAGQIVLLKK